jgi:Transposase and inactivated derivatives
MRTLKIQDAHTFNELSENITSIKGYNNVIDWKIIQCVKFNPGVNANEISKILCISPQKVYKVVQEYNKKGKDYKKTVQWGGRRQETSFLTPEEEVNLLNIISCKANKGLIITAKGIKKEIEKRIGRKVSDDYIWSLFKRHSWTKKSPRPKHPKTDTEMQEEFKKNSKKTWQPPS